MTKAHKLSASQVAVFPCAPRSQETIDPMMPGRAAAALPAKLARARPRAAVVFWPILSSRPCRMAWEPAMGCPLLPRQWEQGRECLSPCPCSRKSVRMRSASVLSSWRSRLMVSRIRLIWDGRAALFVERTSSLACRSSSMSESSPFFIRSRISCWISVSSVSVSFRRSLAKCFSTSDFRSSTSDSFARLLASSSLILVMASLTPARSLVALDIHVVSIGGSPMDFNAVSTSPVVPMTSLVAPERSFSSMDSMFFGRASSALRSAPTASWPSPRDTPDL